METVLTMPIAGRIPTEPAGKKQEMTWEAVERQDWHLWIVAVLLMFVLGVSLVSFMFPTAFWFGGELAIREPQRAFLGFCILLALVLVYLLQRQAAMRRLKRQLYAARAAASEAERKADIQAFLTLPGIGQFRDSLAMEYRRASHTQARLAVVLISVRNPSREQMGQVTTLLRVALRRGETIARLSETTLGMILPGMQCSEAAAFASQTEEHLAGRIPSLKTISTVTSYPQEAASLAELENPLRGISD